MGDRGGMFCVESRKRVLIKAACFYLIYFINLFFQHVVLLYFELSCTACQTIWTGDLILAKLSVNILLTESLYLYLSFCILLQVSEEETMRVGTLCTLI